MHPAATLSLAILLAACVTATEAPDDLRTRQMAACTATIAAHVNRPASVITTRWVSESAGLAQVETLDGTRRHLCIVDGAARVLSYSHPEG